MLLLLDKGRGLGVLTRFCVCASGSFLTVETGRDSEMGLLGVAAAGGILALTLLLPGAVIDSLPIAVLSRLGVAGCA